MNLKSVTNYLSLLDLISYEQDVWTEIAKFLDGKSLVMLAATCRWFHELVMEGCIWRYLCLRDLQVPAPRHPAAFDWKKLYISSFSKDRLISLMCDVLIR